MSADGRSLPFCTRGPWAPCGGAYLPYGCPPCAAPHYACCELYAATPPPPRRRALGPGPGGLAAAAAAPMLCAAAFLHLDPSAAQSFATRSAPHPLPPPPPRDRPPPPPPPALVLAPPPQICGSKGLAGGAEARRRLAAVLCEAAAAAGAGASAAAGRGAGPALTCAACDALPRGPWTAACGHALCATCWPCPRCQPAARAPASAAAVSAAAVAAAAAPAPAPPPAHRRLPSVLLRTLQAACWPREARAQELLAQGDPAALRAFVAEVADDSETETSPLLLSLQCHALHLLDRHREALVAADKLRHMLPSWSRGHYWRGCLLLLASRTQEALASLLLAVALSAGQAPPNPAGMPGPHTLVQAGLGQLCSLSEVHLQLLVNWISKEITRLKRLESKTGNELLVVPLDLPPGIEETDFDCVLCSRILWKPVTTPCGHTFCAGCLDRCLDHTATCPLCMAPLHDLLSSSHCTSVALKATLELMLPASSLYSRELSARTELAAPAHVPVFVCTVAWPGVPCPLYVFEPRYRLLVRRCVETGNRVFGMAAGAEGGHGFEDVGTLLNVRDWLRLPDGCSLLTAVGARRFRVVARAERDGYFTARVDFLEDSAPNPGVEDLAEKVRYKGQQWVANMPPNARAEVERAFGHMPAQEPGDCSPPDGPAWSWWLLAILPLSPRLQVSILATTCLEKRLQAIDKTLDHIQ